MPFEEEEKEPVINKKIGLKQVSSQKSMFDTNKSPTAPTPQQFDERVQQVSSKSNDYKIKAGELAVQYKKILADKTLVQNKNVFSEEIEREILTKMVNLAIQINNDEDEQEGMGSLGWITILLKTQFSVRDRLNELEYQLLQLKKQNEELSKQLLELNKTPGLDSASKGG